MTTQLAFLTFTLTTQPAAARSDPGPRSPLGLRLRESNKSARGPHHTRHTFDFQTSTLSSAAASLSQLGAPILTRTELGRLDASGLTDSDAATVNQQQPHGQDPPLRPPNPPSRPPAHFLSRPLSRWPSHT
eukprot:901401-Rhodomonas_salina.6